MRTALLLALLATPAAGQDLAFITTQEAGTLAVIDLAAGAVQCSADLGGKPAALAVDPARRVAYVVAAESRRLFVVGADCTIRQSVVLEGGPFGVALNAPRGVLYVADWYGARVLEISLPEMGILRSFAVGTVPAGIAVTPDGANLLVAERDDNSIAVLDAETGNLQKRFAVGKHPFGITLHDGRAFTADVESDSVTVIDLATGAVAGTIPVGKRPYAVAFAGGRGFVTNQYADTVTVFDAATLQPMAEVEVGEYPEGIDTSSDGAWVLVANWFSNTVTVIDTKSLDIVAEIEVPDGPRAFGEFVLP